MLVNKCSKLFPVTSFLISHSNNVLDSTFHTMLHEVELCFKEINQSLICQLRTAIKLQLFHMLMNYSVLIAKYGERKQNKSLFARCHDTEKNIVSSTCMSYIKDSEGD